MKSNEDLPEVESGLEATHVNFYNPDICGCYLHNGDFYEDQEFTNSIVDPTTYKKIVEEEVLEEIIEGDPRWVDPKVAERKSEQELIDEIVQEVKQDE